MANIVPYSFETSELPQGPTRPLRPGLFQGVHFTCDAEQRTWLLSKIERWFESRDEIILVASGTTFKEEQGYIILEWEACEIDQLFLAVLRDEDLITDFSVYLRDSEV